VRHYCTTAGKSECWETVSAASVVLSAVSFLLSPVSLLSGPLQCVLCDAVPAARCT